MVSENHKHHRGDGGDSKRRKVNPMSWCWGGWWVAKNFDAMSTALSLNKEWWLALHLYGLTPFFYI